MSDEKVMVSVVMAVYNGAKYVAKTLDSVLAQKYRNFELICVNDGSSDNSAEILAQYAAKDSRIKVVSKENGGPGSARNCGMTHATGKYLLFLDSDDFFDPDLMADTVATAEMYDADIVAYRANFVDYKTGKVTKTPNFEPAVLRAKQPFSLKENHAIRLIDFPGGAAWNYLYSQGFIRKNDIRFYHTAFAEDMFFTRTALALADRIACLNRPYVQYQVGNGGSLMASATKHPTDGMQVVTAISQKIREAGLEENYRGRLNELFFSNFLVNFNFMTSFEAANELFHYAKAILPPKPDDFSVVSHDETIVLTAEHLYFARDTFEFICLQRELVSAEMERAEIAEERLNELRNSLAFRLGNALLYLPRKIRKILRRHE